MIAQNIIGTKLGLFFVSITFLGAPTKLFSMDYPDDNVSVSRIDNRELKIKNTKFEFKCHNEDVELTKYKIKEIFKNIARKNSQKKEKIDALKIVECYIAADEARYLARKANEYDITKLDLPETNIYKIGYRFDSDLGKNIWHTESKWWNSELSNGMCALWGLPTELYVNKRTYFDSYNGMTYIVRR